MSANTLCGTNCCHNFLRPLPLIVPAVKSETCSVDQELLNARIWKVAALSLALFVTSLFIPVAGIYLQLSGIATLGIIPLDRWRAERAADKQATDEYLNSSSPSAWATIRIRKSVRAARWLINQDGDVTKKNNLDESVLSRLGGTKGASLEVFKLLISHLKEKDPNDSLFMTFWDVVSLKDSSFLKYILEKKIFTPEPETIWIWEQFKNAKSALLLKQHGFDLNEKDYVGQTALMKLAKFASDKMNQHCIETLIKLGADRSLKHKGKTASDMCTDPVMKALLRPPKNSE